MTDTYGTKVFQTGPERGTVAVFVVLSVILFAISVYSYLVFHTLVELFALVVAFGTFGVAWYSRRWIGTSSLLMLGVGYLFVGVTDLAHLLTYKGVSITPFASVETAIEFWLIGRGLEAAAFLIAVARPMARFRLWCVFAAFGAATAVMAAVVALGLFPDTYVEGEGLTAFKVGAEYAIVAVLAAAWLLLRRHAGDFDPMVRHLLMHSLAVKALAELCFTLYVDPYGLSNFIGHVLKVVSYYLFLRAVVETGLTRPQALIFGAIEREKELAGEVQRHATMLDAVLDASLDTVVMIDREGRFLFVSRAGDDLFGRTGGELAGRTWREAGLAVATMGPIEELCRRVLDSGQPATGEFRIPDGDHARSLEAQVAPLRSDKGAVTAVVAVIRDITQRKGMEENLKATLDDNRVLMMEVHHRVKNNLQIVSSLLQMQGWRVTDPTIREHFDEACGRILSLAKVHEMLYDEENAAAVDFARYMHSLVADLFKMYAVREDWVAFRPEPGTLVLPLDKAVPLALIVHELVTDAIRHGFGEQGGELRLGIGVEDGSGVLRIADDGTARSKTPGDAATAPLGLRMVEVLVKQVQGRLSERRDGGNVIEVRFPLRDTAPRPPGPVLAKGSVA